MTQAGEAKVGTLFTRESADRALPYVRAVVEDLVAAFTRFHSSEAARARLTAGGGGGDPRARDEALRRADEERLAAREAMDRVLRELEAVGVELKDAEKGLIDFPAEIDGRRAYLCWKRGEERVSFWHDLETGFAGRRRLPDAPAAGEAAPA